MLRNRPYVLFLIAALLSTSCKREPVEPACPDLPESFVPSQTQALFLDLTFDQEFGQASERLRKWDGPISVSIEGDPPAAVRQEVRRVMAELAALSTAIVIDTVATVGAANLRLFLGKMEDYVALVEPAAAGLAEGNSGFATIAWDDTDEITRASACVDIVNFPDPLLHRHVLREELAQALGLINDTELEEESIFHQFIDTRTAYSALDSLMIRYMLGDDLRPGMCPEAVMAIVP